MVVDDVLAVFAFVIFAVVGVAAVVCRARTWHGPCTYVVSKRVQSANMYLCVPVCIHACVNAYMHPCMRA